MTYALETLALASTDCPPAVRLGNQHGYSFEGDFVHLHAEILIEDSAALAQRPWALQLWACEAQPAAPTDTPLQGFKIAELPLDIPAYAAPADRFTVSGTPVARIPAGYTAHTMRLALCAKDAEDQLYDLAAYPALQQFIQPRLCGDITIHTQTGIDTEAGTCTFNIQRIENPRSDDNLSGTLTLELRAAGQVLVSTTLGVLNGQSAWENASISLATDALPAHTPLTLVLREWGPNGYLDRDARDIPAPSVSAPMAVAEVVAANADLADLADQTKETAPPAVTAATPAPAAVAPAKKAVAATGTSVNTASASELQAVKGISAALAKAIVAGRPYLALDELVRVKGVGPKLLEKLRALLSL